MSQPPQQELPAGPFYLPSVLPTGWELTSVRFFTEVDHSTVDAEEAASVTLYQPEVGYAGGGITVSVTRPAAQAPTGTLSLGNHEPVAIEGILQAEIEYDESSEFGSVFGLIDDETAFEMLGDVSPDQLLAVAAALRISDGDVLTVEVDLDGWVAEPTGDPGETYLLGLRGPEGSLEVSATPGLLESSLYRGGSYFDKLLEGEVGSGYYAVQRVEAENLEFPRVVWWVPNVWLTTGVGPELALIVEILDSFVEVDQATFSSAVDGLPVEVIPLEPMTSSEPSDPDEDGEPFDPELLAVLVEFVETTVGRQFEQTPTVTIVDGNALRSSVPAGAFVSVSLWELLDVLGLIGPNDSQSEADATRRDQLRGVCCPVAVIDTGDPLFNQVVIVHELTHGLDTAVGVTNTGSVEVIDPTISLVEGNAHRVAFDYAALLNDDGANIPPPPNVFPPEGDARLPTTVQRILEFHYREGREFTVDLFNQGGEQAILDAFANPPRSTEQILNPDAYLNGDQPQTVPAPAIPGEATILQQGTLGAFLISLMVESSLGLDSAADLAFSWAGDTYILYEQQGQACLIATIIFDDATSARQAAQAIAPLGDTETRSTETSLTTCP